MPGLVEQVQDVRADLQRSGATKYCFTPGYSVSSHASERTVRPRARSPTNAIFLPSIPPRFSKLRWSV